MENNCAYNNNTSEDINISIKFSIEDDNDFSNNPFCKRMWENYRSYIDEFKELIKNRSQYEGMRESFPESIRALNLYDYSQHITDMKLRKMIELTALWYFYQSVNTPYSFTSTDDKGKTTINYNNIIRYLEQKYNPIVWKGTFYLYIDNQYHRDVFLKIRKDVDRIIQGEGIPNIKMKTIFEEVVLIAKVRWQKHTEISPFNSISNLIPVKNGVISFNGDLHIFPCSPVWGYTYSLPVYYNDKADESMISQFITDCCIEDGIRQDEKENLLVQIPAQALMQITANPAYLLSGGGSNGKSTYINFLKEFVSVNNCTSISLQEIAKEKFKRAELYGKLFNLYADIPREIVGDAGNFKMLTGGDNILGEYKYGNPFNFVNKSVFVFSANELPQVSDNTFAFWRRWNLIEFNNRFSQDESFFSKLCTENNKSAFLNIIIRKIVEIKKNGLKVNNKTYEIMENWKRKSNSAYAFIIDGLEKSSNDVIRKKELYNQYHQYCEDFDVTEIQRNKFYEEVEKTFNVKEVYVTIDRVQERGFKGIRFKTVELQKEEIKQPILAV